MKKLIFLLLIFTSCTDQELIKKSDHKIDPVVEAIPMNCPDPQIPEPKFFQLYTSFSGSTPDYFENITVGFETIDLFYPDRPVGDYVVTIIIKNESPKNVKYWKNGTYIGLLLAGASKTYTWTGFCDECLGPDCPQYVNQSFYFSIASSTSSGQQSCEADISITLYSDDWNNPDHPGNVWNYTFINQAC